MARPRKTEEGVDITINDGMEQPTETNDVAEVVTPVVAKKAAKPLQPLAGGHSKFNLCVINVEMRNRRNEQNGRAEGHAVKVDVVKVLRSSSMSKDTADTLNMHLMGTAISSPGTPNHTQYWIPAEHGVEAGQSFNCETKRVPLIDQYGNENGEDRRVFIDWQNKL